MIGRSSPKFPQQHPRQRGSEDTEVDYRDLDKELSKMAVSPDRFPCADTLTAHAGKAEPSTQVISFALWRGISHWILTGKPVEEIPFAITNIVADPVAIPLVLGGTSKLVVVCNPPVAMPMVLWPCVRA